MNTNMKIMMHANSCSCASCVPVPTLGFEMPYEKKKAVKKKYKQCLAITHPEVANMLSKEDKFLAQTVTSSSNAVAIFVCPECGQKYERKIRKAVEASNKGNYHCPVCTSRKIIPGINDLASQCPEAAAMWSSKNEKSASEVAAKSSKKAIFVCANCKQEFEYIIGDVVRAISNGNTGCSICAGRKIVPGINDLATKCPKAAAMLSKEDKFLAQTVTSSSNTVAIFVCPDCGKEFKTKISNVTRSVGNGFTGCYDCSMRRINTISKPECFVVRFMLAFAGENGIANPFFDVQNILGDGRLGLDFVDHIQKLCAEYNGNAWHGDDKHVARDRFKFEAAHKAGYIIIRIQEPGLEVLDPKYDIVMPEGFYRNGKYDAEIMEEVGRKIIHLLEEIYGRKASPEIWALNNFKEFEVWYDANKKDLEANAQKNMKSHKTAAKKAA